MSRNQFLDKIVKDWRAIVVCIGISLAVYLIHQTTTLDKKTFAVPLGIQASGIMVPAESTAAYRYVRITVRAPAEQLATISDSDFTAGIDLDYLTKPGQYSLPVVIQPNERVLLMEPLELLASPEYITLSVDENVFRFVPVEASVTGEPAYGYEVSSVSCEPEFIKVSGPALLVDAVSSVRTGAVVVQDLSAGAVVPAGIIHENSLVHIADGAEEVSVSVSVEPVVSESDFSGVPIALSNVPQDFEASLSVPSLSLRARGRLLAMDSLRPSSFTARADCSLVDAEGTYDVPVVVSPPSGISVVSQDVQTVQVSVHAVSAPADSGAEED